MSDNLEVNNEYRTARPEIKRTGYKLYSDFDFPASLDFDPSHTFECGQAFRWLPLDDSRIIWRGIVSGCLLEVSKSRARLLGQTKDISEQTDNLIRRYFSVETDLRRIQTSLPHDDYLDRALREYWGLRILNQDPWECLISFLCSINCNIPSIRLKIDCLSRRYGERIESRLEGKYHAFPRAEVLARASKTDLLSCRVGFRWKYIKRVATDVIEGRLDLNRISKMRYTNAREELISEISHNTFGVGPKVADCVMLFSLRKLEAFPIDVWMMRCIRHNYSNLAKGLVKEEQISRSAYFSISEIMRKYFGEFAGYAQQYLYVKTRSAGKFIPNKAQV